jgi:DNA polymerase III alpha subunit (gram-positive type)
MNKKYIILELIPSAIDPSKGPLIQISALKLDNLQLIDRFDYRLNEDKLPLTQFAELISYDKDNFKYVDSHDELMKAFIDWIEDLDLIIINNDYTNNYLRHLDNNKISILDLLDMEYSFDVIDKIISKYNLQPSNYIVDLLYEALIYESNNKDITF